MTLTHIILILIFIALMSISFTLFNILFDIRYWEYRKRFEKSSKGIDPDSGVSFKEIYQNTNKGKLVFLNFFITFVMMAVISGILIYILKIIL